MIKRFGILFGILIITPTIFGQNVIDSKSVSGTVMSYSGIPIPGVRIKGNSHSNHGSFRNTQSDSFGSFKAEYFIPSYKLNIYEGKPVPTSLKFSKKGFKSKTYKTNGGRFFQNEAGDKNTALMQVIPIQENPLFGKIERYDDKKKDQKKLIKAMKKAKGKTKYWYIELILSEYPDGDYAQKFLSIPNNYLWFHALYPQSDNDLTSCFYYLKHCPDYPQRQEVYEKTLEFFGYEVPSPEFKTQLELTLPYIRDNEMKQKYLALYFDYCPKLHDFLRAYKKYPNLEGYNYINEFFKRTKSIDDVQAFVDKNDHLSSSEIKNLKSKSLDKYINNLIDVRDNKDFFIPEMERELQKKALKYVKNVRYAFYYHQFFPDSPYMQSIINRVSKKASEKELYQMIGYFGASYDMTIPKDKLLNKIGRFKTNAKGKIDPEPILNLAAFATKFPSHREKAEKKAYVIGAQNIECKVAFCGVFPDSKYAQKFKGDVDAYQESIKNLYANKNQQPGMFTSMVMAGLKSIEDALKDPDFGKNVYGEENPGNAPVSEEQKTGNKKDPKKSTTSNCGKVLSIKENGIHKYGSYSATRYKIRCSCGYSVNFFYNEQSHGWMKTSGGFLPDYTTPNNRSGLEKAAKNTCQLNDH
jgi:hypothetical protein